MRHTPLYPLLLLALCATLAACSPQEETDTQTSLPASAGQRLALSPEQIELAGIKTGTLSMQVLSQKISCSGELEVPPQGKASVSVPMGGFLEESSLIAGTYVKKGQQLARLSSPDYISLQQAYLETLSALRFAEQEWQRQQMLGEQNATATKKLQQSQAEWGSLKGTLAGLRARLQLLGAGTASLEQGTIQQYIYLRAPISGTITSINHHQGQFVESREVLFEIVNQEQLHLELQVFEQDVARIEKGQAIEFTPSGTSQRYSARVSLISPQRKGEERTYTIHAHLEKQEPALKPGLFVAAEILLSPEPVAALPERAVIYQEGNAYVLLEEEGSYRLEAVTPGAKQGGWVQIMNPEPLENRRLVLEGASRVHAALQRAH